MRNLVELFVFALVSSVCFTQCTSEEIFKEILEEESKDSTITEEPIDSIVEETDSIISEIPNPLYELIMNDNQITIFAEALKATGLNEQLKCIIDSTYNPGDYPWYYYTSDMHKEVSTVPDRKMDAYTLFIETDSVLTQKYAILCLEDLIEFSKHIYNQTYPEDAGLYDDDYTNPKNPLYRFVAYHILKCKIDNINFLTGKIIQTENIDGPIGIRTDKINPIEWYQTLLPNTMIKCEMLTMSNWMGSECTLSNYYLNRRWDNNYQIRGSEVSTPQQENSTLNGNYYYVDDIMIFTPHVRDKVQNMLIRMDFSTIFPELISHGIRQNGDPMRNDNDAFADETFKNGRNYYFPMGYLYGVILKGDCHLIYRRPHLSYYDFCGDAMNLFGEYDFEFRLPPIPYSGEWQIRIGYSVTSTRGIAQFYFDGVPQGEPLDMSRSLSHESIMGTLFTEVPYDEMTVEERIADQKALKSKGYYRGLASAYYADSKARFETLAETPRRVIYQGYIDNTKSHTLRIQNAGEKTIGNNNEFMLDYIEFVPKNVYNVPDGEMESEL